MLQIKTIMSSLSDMDAKVNEFLKTIPEDNVRSIEVNDGFVLIQYIVEETWQKNLCCDCQLWDDTEGSTVAFCQAKGIRKRFNCKACNQFKDIRGGTDGR